MADDSGQETESDPVTAIRNSLKQVLTTLKSLLGREEEGLSQEMRDAERGQGAGAQPQPAASQQQDQGRTQQKSDAGDDSGENKDSSDGLQPTLQ